MMLPQDRRFALSSADQPVSKIEGITVARMDHQEARKNGEAIR